MRTQAFTLAVLLLLAPAMLRGAQPADTLLYYTDFSRLDPGVFAEFASRGFPEYHHVPREFTDGWEVVNNRTPEEWKVFELDGEYTLEFLAYNSTMWTSGFIYPIMVTGDHLWGDYDMQATVTALNPTDLSGIVFRYQDGRHYYVFGFGPGDTLSLRYRDGEKDFRRDGWRILATASRELPRSEPVVLRVEARGTSIRCYVDGDKVFAVTDDRYSGGKVGLFATSPVRYHDVTVTTTESAKKAWLRRAGTYRAELEAARRDNPAPRLWKRIATPEYGVARAMRIGDLDNDGEEDLLLVQNIPFFGGNYNRISCMTAIDLDGNVLWQYGKPDREHAWVTYDVAAQIHDIDDDGESEVVFAEERWIKVLDGATGREESRHLVPESKILPGEESWDEYDHYYRRDHLEYLNVDCFAFCDLRGNGKPLDVIIKDRHTRLWAYNNEFELLWTATANLGHYPYFRDYDNDGRDEVYLGYTLFDHDGSIVWSKDDELKEHADGICAGDFCLDGGPDRVFITASDDGVVMLDEDAEIILHDRVGHAQTPSVGQFFPETKSLEFCNINFWGEPGLITFYDCNGKKLSDFEIFHQGSPVLPVNWRGDGTEYVMLSPAVHLGGMVDGQGRRVVMFPDDGHPTLAYLVHDLTGDARDEIICWDPDRIWIYTQDQPFEGGKIYAPKRQPPYNESNYRPEISWPAWEKTGE